MNKPSNQSDDWKVYFFVLTGGTVQAMYRKSGISQCLIQGGWDKGGRKMG